MLETGAVPCVRVSVVFLREAKKQFLQSCNAGIRPATIHAKPQMLLRTAASMQGWLGHKSGRERRRQAGVARSLIWVEPTMTGKLSVSAGVGRPPVRAQRMTMHRPT